MYLSVFNKLAEPGEAAQLQEYLSDQLYVAKSLSQQILEQSTSWCVRIRFITCKVLQREREVVLLLLLGHQGEQKGAVNDQLGELRELKQLLLAHQASIRLLEFGHLHEVSLRLLEEDANAQVGGRRWELLYLVFGYVLRNHLGIHLLLVCCSVHLALYCCDRLYLTLELRLLFTELSS